jgi:CubicO group peptidase (beta-lactamase class C family)
MDTSMITKMLRHLLILLSAFTVTKSFSQSSDSIDRYIEQTMRVNHIPGAAVAVIRKGTIIKEGYYGIANLEDSTYVGSQSVFEIASMSKQFTCAAILLLQQDGKLSVNDKLSKYLDSLPSSWSNITIKELMNHTSGLRDDWVENTGYFLENYTDDKMLASQKKAPLLFTPGEMFNYSSGPFDLGIVIQKITGKSYAQFLQERIFTPLQMTSTSVYDNSRIVPHRVRGYVWRNGNTLQNAEDISPAAEARGDVGVITSLPDMMKWNAALKNGTLLSNDSRKQMFTPGTLKSGSYIGYGLGWFIVPFSGHIMIEHSGGFRTGFNSDIMRFPDVDLDVIVLTNLWNGGISSFKIAAIADSGIKLVAGLPAKKDPDDKRTQELTAIIKDEIESTSTNTPLRKKLFLGLMPQLIGGALHGFEKLTYIDSLNLKTKPIFLYGETITKIIFYKTNTDAIKFLSAYYNDKNQLVCLYPDD